MTPELMPLPPCTAMPAGLLITSRPLVLDAGWRASTCSTSRGGNPGDFAGRLGRRLHAHRRHAQHVARRNAHFAADPLAVEPHLALAQQPEQPRARHARQQARQHLVDAAAGILGAHGFDAHRGALTRRRRSGEACSVECLPSFST